MKRQVWLASWVMCVACSWASATMWYPTDLVADGDFSTDPLTNGWTLTQGNSANYYWQWDNQRVTLRGTDASPVVAKLQQQVAGLTSGVQYKVTGDTDFWGDAYVDWGTLYLSVYDANGTLISRAQRDGGVNTVWQTMETSFTAPSNGTVKIEITSTQYWWEPECYWDNVVMYSSVPEPATMSLVSLCGLALLRRKK